MTYDHLVAIISAQFTVIALVFGWLVRRVLSEFDNLKSRVDKLALALERHIAIRDFFCRKTDAETLKYGTDKQ